MKLTGTALAALAVPAAVAGVIASAPAASAYPMVPPTYAQLQQFNTCWFGHPYQGTYNMALALGLDAHNSMVRGASSQSVRDDILSIGGFDVGTANLTVNCSIITWPPSDGQLH
jgi:hypothetical protein